MFKKLLAGLMLAALSLTAIAPATVSAGHKSDSTLLDRLVQLETRTGNFGIVIAAAQCYGTAVTDLLDGVDGALAGIDNGTLYAPTNRAFKKSIPGVNASNVCIKVGEELLFDVLTDHVSYERTTQRDIRRQAWRNGAVDTIGGGIDVSGRWWKPKLGSDNPLNDPGTRDKARVRWSLNASNGILHIVDRVIVQLEPATK